MVYTIEIIHLRVSKIDGYLPPLRWMIVYYGTIKILGF